MRKRPSLLVNTALVALGCLVGLLLLEIGLRARTYVIEGYGATLEARLQASSEATPDVDAGTNLRGIIRPSPFDDIVYELRPNLRGTFLGKPFAFSSIGIRDQEYAVAKPAGTFRVVGIGDSVMFGWGVDAEDAYLSRLEQTLNRDAPGSSRFEVLNFAVPGYNTTMEVATLERKALAYHPDMVVVHFVGNDLELPLFMQSQRDVLDRSSSFLVEFLRGRFSKGEDDDVLAPTAQQRVPEKYLPMVGTDGFVKAMERLAGLTAAPKIPVVIVTGSLNKNLQQFVTTRARQYGFAVLPIKPYVDALARREGIGDTPAERNAALHLSPSDAHPNALGHQPFADALVDYLRAHAAR